MYSGINIIPQIARTHSSKSVEFMERNNLKRTQHHHELHKQQTERKICKVRLAQHNCINKYLTESKLNSDSSLSICKSGQDSGAPNSHWMWEQEKAFGTQAMFFCPHFSWKKKMLWTELIKLVDSRNLLDQQNMALYSLDKKD